MYDSNDGSVYIIGKSSNLFHIFFYFFLKIKISKFRKVADLFLDQVFLQMRKVTPLGYVTNVPLPFTYVGFWCAHSLNTRLLLIVL